MNAASGFSSAELRIGPTQGAYVHSVKRIFDAILATIALLIVAPVLLLTAVAILVGLGRPVIFRQTRPGLGGKPFVLFKFRTMHVIDLDRGLTDDASRLTPFGHLIRRLSLDELPSLWNVIKGDMSLVGPRPLLMEYLGRYSAHQARRHEVRPGLTGLAQVSGRNRMTWTDRLDLDVLYVDAISLGLDLKILTRTAWVVLRARGVSASGEATMSEFRPTEISGTG